MIIIDKWHKKCYNSGLMKENIKKLNILKSLKRLFPYMMGYKLLFISGFLAMIFISIAQLLDPLILAHIIDVSVPNKDIADMVRYGIFFVLVIMVTGVMSYFQTILLARLGVKIIIDLKRQVFEHILKLPVSYFDENPVGKLIARVESDCEKVKQLFSQFSIMVFGSILFFIGMIAVLFWKNWQITFFLIIPLPFVFVLIMFAIRYLATYYRKIRHLYAELSGLLAEYIQGTHIVQIFNKRKIVENIINKKSKEKKKQETKAAFYEYSFWSIYSFLIETMFIVLVILLTTPKIFAGLMTLGTLIVFIQYGRRMFEPIIMISETFNMIQRAFVSLERIFSILDLETEKNNEKGIVPIFNKSIRFDNVWFKYKKDEWVLKDINFEIKKGEKIAFVGASGSGKTTTVSLLERFYAVDKGSITVDSNNINDFPLQQWRKMIGLVLQDIYLFPGNIIENVRIYNNDINKEQVEKALKAVEADNFISKKKHGIDMELNERGQNISVGEKQLLSFARALVISPEIVIMDEATSSVDAQTEKKIQKVMDKILKNKTAIIVAHRLSSVVNADKILLFSNGKIIARGKHLELMKTSKEYQKLVELQFLSVKEDNNASH